MSNRRPTRVLRDWKQYKGQTPIGGAPNGVCKKNVKEKQQKNQEKEITTAKNSSQVRSSIE